MVTFNLHPSQTMHLEFAGWMDETMLDLIEQEIDEYKAVFGINIKIGKAPSGQPRWIIQEDSTVKNPTLTWNSSAQQISSLVQDSSQVFDTFSLLHSLAHSSQNEVSAREPVTVDEAINLLYQEVKNTYPYFAIRKLSWEQLFEEALNNKPTKREDFTVWSKKLIAQLGDAHTSIIDHQRSRHRTPYAGKLTGSVLTLTEIPPYSEAAKAGVKKGWQIEISNTKFWEETTGATPQQFAEITARNAMAFGQESRKYTALNPGSSKRISWEEVVTPPSLNDILTIRHIDERLVYIKLRSFIANLGIEEEIEKLCQASSENDFLILDLRNNSGGNIMLACTLRDMFLREETLIGYSSFTSGKGTLSELRERWATPHPRAQWRGKLIVLINSLTYSASEDFLLGLKGLEHVELLGTRSGGGSGRPRTIPLVNNLLLRISTAITYDRNKRPVEFFGIEPDGPIPEELMLTINLILKE